MSMLQTLAKVHPSLISNEKIETSQRCLTLAMIRNCNEALTQVALAFLSWSCKSRTSQYLATQYPILLQKNTSLCSNFTLSSLQMNLSSKSLSQVSSGNIRFYLRAYNSSKSSSKTTNCFSTWLFMTCAAPRSASSSALIAQKTCQMKFRQQLKNSRRS